MNILTIHWEAPFLLDLLVQASCLKEMNFEQLKVLDLEKGIHPFTVSVLFTSS